MGFIMLTFNNTKTMHRGWKPIEVQTVLNNILWLESYEFTLLTFNTSLCQQYFVHHDLLIEGNIFERVGDGWLERDKNAKLYGFINHDPRLFSAEETRLEISANDDFYEFKLIGINKCGVNRSIYVNRNEVKQVKINPHDASPNIFRQFAQLSIMLASLINSDYLELLERNIDSMEFSLIVPLWKIRSGAAEITFEQKLKLMIAGFYLAQPNLYPLRLHGKWIMPKEETNVKLWTNF